MTAAPSHLVGRTVIVTGAAGGFGRLVSQKAAAREAHLVCCDLDQERLDELVGEIRDAGGSAITAVADVTDLAAMKAVVATAVDQFGEVDVMVNNAGVMPLAFFSDHEAAADAEPMYRHQHQGRLERHDRRVRPDVEPGRGHVVNVSSIYGNFPVVGAAVYGATKAAVNMMSEAFRVETQGQIKVTIVKPTGVPGTGLGGGVINPAAITGILGQNTAEYLGVMQALREGTAGAEALDADDPAYAALEPVYIADAILHAIDQPWGVAIGDITVRATGDRYIL
ncbi:MAG: SDR family NAD(P)-dependent oxidoreductase [Acidimicrobiales bacterium]